MALFARTCPVVARSVSGAIVRTHFGSARLACPRVLAVTLVVGALSMSVAIPRAHHFCARISSREIGPSFEARTLSVITMPVILAELGAHFRTAVGTFPSRRAAALVGSDTGTMVAAVGLGRALRNGTIDSTPVVAQARTLATCTVSVPAANFLFRSHRAARILTRFSVVVRVALTSSVRTSSSCTALHIVLS